MFLLAEIKDTIRLPPTKFGLNMEEAISNELNKKLANKVVYNVGLCIGLHDIIEIGDSFILPGDGASCTPVKFRFVVFRPFIDEILVGRIKACSHEGVTVSMEFFDDIIIPYEYLQQPSKFDEEEQLWVWEYETDEGTHDLFMDINEEIRFRVIDENFTDLTPTGPEKASQDQPGNQEEKSPYCITATITEPGLGLFSWWANS
ncbi:DNA-directed RNA polymerase III subunit RPC8-like [Dendronephthya gigantea]|uniref:DNA-directed RNA polymerase III subunit RPC8-like n=1 Tax=Dendronephthya gigantea TaxID=151771 RepID=UPI00106A8E74|nr:DNA-directed RNA polymerase III subunit RPC8-like [Dendronephthya gigantea]